ncbi:MAG: ATP-binding protein, partial [Holophaga sp.]|nr:ATP-binding protein [Holophaga sp.]
MAVAFARHSIKVKVTLATVAIFLVGLWSLALYANRLLRMDLLRLLSDQQAASVSLVAATINARVWDRLTALEGLALQVGPVLPGRAEQLQTLLEQRPILEILFNSGTFITGTDGTAIAAIPSSMGRQGVNYMVRDAVAAALAGQVSVGGIAMGIRAKAPIFVMGVPLRDHKGKVIGALAGVTNLAQANFLDALTQGGYGKTGGYLLALPRSREILTATDKGRIQEILPAPGVIPAMDRFLQGYEGSTIFVNRYGIERLASAKGIPAAGWVLIAELPTQEAFAPLHKLQNRLWLATVLLTGLAGGLTWWVVKRQLAPMLATARTLATLANLATETTAWQPLPISHPDEIGDMIDGFNHLVNTLAQRELALAESEKNYHQLQKAESLGRMAGSIAHHFNNKLQAVMANLDVLSQLPKGADPARFLAMAKQGAEKAAEVSRLMLTYLGQTALKREPCHLSDRCQVVLASLQSSLPSNVTVATEFPSPGPVVSANAEQLQQLLSNLLSNAAEAMGGSEGTVRISLRTCSAQAIDTAHRFPVAWQPSEPDYACLEVTDTGCGIAEADFGKLFDPFFSTKFVGRGL